MPRKPRRKNGGPLHTAQEMQDEIHTAFGEAGITTRREEETPESNSTHVEEATHYRVGRNTVSMIDPTEWELEDSHEPFALKDGAEALLRIIEVAKGIRHETNTEYYTVRLEVPAEPFSKDITDWLDVPSRNMDPKRLNAARQKMMHFMECFKIDRTEPSDPTEDWVGFEGWCILSLRSSEQYGEQNRISKFVRAR